MADRGFAAKEHVSLLKAMVRLSAQNKLRAERTKVTKCPYCKGAGKGYVKKDHPKGEDCAGTGVATTWR